MRKKKKFEIGNIVEIFEENPQYHIKCTSGLGVVVSKTISGDEYRIKNLTTLREKWYESKDLEDVTETYPHLLTNCCLIKTERDMTYYYRITAVKLEDGEIYVWCTYDHFWHNLKDLEKQKFELV